jgi:hypothetical protein
LCGFLALWEERDIMRKNTATVNKYMLTLLDLRPMELFTIVVDLGDDEVTEENLLAHAVDYLIGRGDDYLGDIVKGCYNPNEEEIWLYDRFDNISQIVPYWYTKISGSGQQEKFTAKISDDEERNRYRF